MNSDGLNSTNDITLSGDSDAYFDTVNATTLVINRPSTTAVNSLLGSTINVGSVLQNSNFDTTNRLYQIWNDTASSSVLQIDTSNSNTAINADGLNLSGQIISIGATDSIYVQSHYTIDLSGNTITLSNAAVSFPSSTVSFNSNLPTTTITTGFASNNFITKAYSDAIYGRLAIANTWDENNTFSKGILPRASSSVTDIQIGGVNQLQYRTAPSAYNVSIGENAVRGYPAVPAYNTGQKNIGIGDSSLLHITNGSHNIGIGFEALQGANPAIYGNIAPNRCIAIGTGAQKTALYGTDNVAIGYNCFPNNGSGINNIMIGSNVGAGLNNRSDNVCIGTNAMGGSAVDNGVVVIGSSALGNASGSCNAMTAIGSNAGRYNAGGSGNTFIGAYSGQNNTSGSQNTYIGVYAGGNGTSGGINNCVIVGYNAQALADNECVFGGEAGGGQIAITLPGKTKLACNLALTGVTVTLAFRINENILLTDATTTTINLPTPNTDGRNEGCKFYINRRVAGVNITINAPTGQFIALNQINGTYTASSTYLFLAGMNSITVLCIGSAASGTNWQVLPTSYAQGTDNLYTSTVNPIPSTAISIPFAGTTVSGYQPYFIDNANLNYRQSTTTLTATNVSSTGTVTATNLTIPDKIRIASNQEYTSGTTINLTFSSNENIILTAATLTTLNLPSIAGSQNIGAKFNIYRSIQTTNSLLINAAAGQTIDFIASDGTYTSLPSGGYFPMYYNDPKAEIICVSTTKWLILCRILSVASRTVNIWTNLVPATTIYSIPFGVSSGASDSPYTTLMNDTGLTFNTSTTTLTSTNMYATTTSTGDMTVRATLNVNLNFQPYETSQLLSSATVLPSLPTLFGVYYFASGASATTIVLPTITADIIGCQLSFRRITNATSNLVIKTPSGSGQTIVQRASITETAAFTNYTFLSTTIFSGTLCAITTTQWAVLA